MVEPLDETGAPVGEWLWRLFAVAAAFAVAFAVGAPSDITGLVPGLIRFVGVVVAFVIAYSYLMSLRRG